MPRVSKNFIIISCWLCFGVCIGDLMILFFMGNRFPGYSQLTGTISSLGASNSPVSNFVSVWWILLGLFFMAYAYSFAILLKNRGRIVKIIAWLIAIYGFGEGIGSGLFKADYINNTMTTSAYIHDTLGGFGVIGILIMPLFMKRIFTKETNPSFYILNTIVFYAGLFFSGLFLFRFMNGNFFYEYKGIWQRLALINNYIYFSSLSAVMLKITRNIPIELRQNS